MHICIILYRTSDQSNWQFGFVFSVSLSNLGLETAIKILVTYSHLLPSSHFEKQRDSDLQYVVYSRPIVV